MQQERVATRMNFIEAQKGEINASHITKNLAALSVHQKTYIT